MFCCPANVVHLYEQGKDIQEVGREQGYSHWVEGFGCSGFLIPTVYFSLLKSERRYERRMVSVNVGWFQ